MAGYLSSVNLIAAAGIIGNVGGVALAANSVAVSELSSYDSLAVVQQFGNVKIDVANANVLTASTTANLYNLASNIFPALTDSVPSNYLGNIGNTTVGGFSSKVTTGINNIMGSGDLGKFNQVFSLADAYRFTTNQIINSAVNANDISAIATYTSQNTTATGGLSQISLAFEVFGTELAALGFAIDLNNLADLGSPQSLLRQIYVLSGGIASLNTELTNAGINSNTLYNIETEPMTDREQKIAFDVMTKITGRQLNQILFVLKVSTSGITTMADLLNPVKMFPNSFNTLTAPTSVGLRGIYINSSGAVNSNLEKILPSNVLAPVGGYDNVQNTYSQLKKIIPPDWALADKALQAGLEQIKSIFSSTPTALGAATNGLESNKGLDLINALTSPLPASVSNYYATTLPSGTGPNGTLLLADIIGTAGGWVVNGNVATTTNVISTMQSSNAFVTLTDSTDGVYSVMANCIAGTYTGNASIDIPSPLPGWGTYADEEEAFAGLGVTTPPGVGLIPAAYSLIGNIVANNVSNVTVANSAWSNIAAQISLETTTQSKANIDYATITSAGSSLTSLATNVGQNGTDTDVGGASWLFESLAVTSTLGGQAIISSMREARNQERLQNAGVNTDIVVSDVGIQQQISPDPGQYTVAEAVSQKII